MTKKYTPYSDLPPKSFWQTGVVQQNPLQCKDFYKKKFEIDRESKIITAGSCFAQHISRYLRNNGFYVVDVEPPPIYVIPDFQLDVEQQLEPTLLPSELHSQYGYSLYSARYGNIYTVRQLLQLTLEAFGLYEPGEVVWEKNGGFYDALRPNVEPDGLKTPEEVKLHREFHLNRVRQAFVESEVFIFTLGLTEAWTHRESGTVFPTVPGLLAGEFLTEKYEFKNFTFSEIIDDFNLFKQTIHNHQLGEKKAKFLLTVSPVPLTATYSGDHILPATTYSKSVLRAAVGELSKTQHDIDYFPSFEIINSCWSRGIFYEPNMRSVTPEGVDIAMNIFLKEHMDYSNAILKEKEQPKVVIPKNDFHSQFEDAVCEESLLEVFLK